MSLHWRHWSVMASQITGNNFYNTLFPPTSKIHQRSWLLDRWPMDFPYKRFHRRRHHDALLFAVNAKGDSFPHHGPCCAPDCEIHWANMGPTWGRHVGPINFTIRGEYTLCRYWHFPDVWQLLIYGRGSIDSYRVTHLHLSLWRQHIFLAS